MSVETGNMKTSEKLAELGKIDSSNVFDVEYKQGSEASDFGGQEVFDSLDAEGEKNTLKWWHVFQKDRLGMPMHYLVVGILYGFSNGIILPVYLYYLESPSSMINIIYSFPSMFFNFKLFYGVLGDCFPLFGYRRRSYMLLGWSISFVVTMITLAWLLTRPTIDYCFPFEPTNKTKYEYDDVVCEGQERVPLPQFDGATFGVFLLLQNFGYIFSDVAASSLSVQWAQEESSHDRGQIQANNYAVRFIGFIIAYCITGFGLNSVEYGGDWGWSFPLWATFLLTGIMQLFILPFCYWVKDEKVLPEDKRSVKQNFKDMWGLIKMKGFCCIFIFAMLFNLFTSFRPKAATSIPNSSVLKLSPMENTLQSIFSMVLYSVTLWAVGKWLRNYNWRLNNVISSFLVMGSAFLILPIVLGPLQHQAIYYIFTQCINGFFDYANYLVVIWAVNELRIPGLEGTAITLATGVGNLASTIGGSWCSNLLGSIWPSLENVKVPGWETDYVYNLLIVTAINSIPLFLLWLIPTNKAMAIHRKETWGESFNLAFATMVLYVIIFVLGVVVLFGSMFCGCMPWLGGGGCIEGTCTYA